VSLIDVIAVFGLTGVFMTGVCGAGIAVLLPGLVLVGLVDGPRGGRWERGRAAGYGAPGGEVHVQPAARRSAA
jgi:hypothetical protein